MLGTHPFISVRASCPRHTKDGPSIFVKYFVSLCCPLKWREVGRFGIAKRLKPKWTRHKSVMSSLYNTSIFIELRRKHIRLFLFPPFLFSCFLADTLHKISFNIFHFQLQYYYRRQLFNLETIYTDANQVVAKSNFV